MIYFSLGLPGRVAKWCDTALEIVTAQNFRRISLLDLSPPYEAERRSVGDQAALELVRSGVDSLVVSYHPPDGGTIAFLRDNQLPFLLSLDDPRHATMPLASRSGLDLLTAARVVANICPSIMDYMTLPGCLTVCSADLVDGGSQVVKRIAKHFAIPLQESPEVIAERVVQQTPDSRDSTIEDNSEYSGAISGLLSGYADFFSGRQLGDFIWKRELFLSATSGERLSGPLQLRDVANGLCLVYGPYISLPSGVWAAKIIVAVSQEAAGQTMVFEAFATHCLATMKFSPKSEGVYSINLTFALDQAEVSLLEIRVMITRNSAPGELNFGEVHLHPVRLGATDFIEQIHGSYFNTKPSYA